MLRFPSSALSQSLETFLRDVRQGPGQALRMPIALQWGGGLGGAVHAVQVIATWARQTDATPVLRLPRAFAEQQSTRERFASTLPGMGALYFAGSLECEEEPFSRHKALETVAPRVAAMNASAFRDTLRGPGVALCCFAGARREFLNPLYSHALDARVRDHEDFRSLLPRMLSSLGVRTTVALSESQLAYLCGLVYELFLNADEHGTFDVRGERYVKGMRGIAVRQTTIEDVASLVRHAKDDTPLRGYLTKLAMLAKAKSAKIDPAQRLPSGPMHLLEVSVFDTGPGLALRWHAKKSGYRSYSEMSMKEEAEAVKTCFGTHATTKAGRYLGEGLAMALSAMRGLEAFMTLRTGRLSLYQDFSSVDSVDFNPKMRFPRVHQLPEIAGAGYTVYFRVK